MISKKLYKIIMCCLLGLLCICGWNTNTHASEKVGEVTVSVEKFTISQGYLIDPCMVPIYQGDNAAKVLDRVLKEYGYSYEYNGSLTNDYYLTTINNADSGYYRIPAIITDMGNFIHNDTGDNERTDKPPTGRETNVVYPDLAEFSYTQNSGWMYSVNNVFPSVALSGKTLSDGDVMRIQFTVYGYGADLGSSYDEESIKALDLPDRQEITKRLALMKKYKDACDEAGVWETYTNAYEVASDLSTSKNAMQNAFAKLPSEDEILSYVDAYDTKQAESFKEKAKSIGNVDLSKEKMIQNVRSFYESLTDSQKAKVAQDTYSILTAAESKIVLLKKEKEEKEKSQNQTTTQDKPATKPVDYTPSATTIKSVKLAGGKKVNLVWKKVTSATGYEIYMSQKKNAGYKKVATINKQSTLKYTKKSLKKKKTYYFKVRTYRIVAGKKYFGKYSNIKKIKVTK